MAHRGRNEGSIYKRSNGTWRAQISINGQRLGYTGNTRAECSEWLRKTLNQVDQGMTFQSHNLILEEYLTDWFSTKQNTIKSKTAYDYGRLLVNCIYPTIGNKKLKDLTTHGITRYYASLKENGKGIRTIHIIHTILRSSLQDAVRGGIIGRNPCIGALIPKSKPEEMKVLTADQVTRFLVAAESSRYKALYHLAITTGMRYGELIGLKWSDIDWDKGTIKIQRQLQYIPHRGYEFNDPKTRSGTRTVLLGKTALAKLKEHYYEYAYRDRTGENLIFVNGIGTKVYFKRFHKDFKRVLELAGLPDIRFHDLRHTAATLMISNGIPVVVVSKILGHSKPSVTMNIYAHVSTEMQTEAAQLMENLVTPIPISLDSPQILD